METRVRELAGNLPHNVGESERLASMLGGALTALYGLKRGDAAGALLALAGGALVARGATGYCPVYAAMDAPAGGTRGVSRVDGPVQQHGRNAVLDASEAERIVQRVTVNAEPARLYAFWRDFTNLPKVMEYVERVELLGGGRSRWRAKSAAGTIVEWESEIIRDEPGEFISWKTVGDAPVAHAGSIHFRPVSGGSGTEVRVEIDYDPPGGRLGRLADAVAGRSPAKQVAEELRRLKEIIEAEG